MAAKYTLDACVDCIAYVANGTVPEDRPTLADDILANLGPTDMLHLVNAEGCNEAGEFFTDENDEEIDPDHPDYDLVREDWFSWSACECCGSTLGGNRNRLAVLTADDPGAEAIPSQLKLDF